MVIPLFTITISTRLISAHERSQLLLRHPGLSLELSFTDQIVDLVEAQRRQRDCAGGRRLRIRRPVAGTVARIAPAFARPGACHALCACCPGGSRSGRALSSAPAPEDCKPFQAAP